ncbi:MAG: hypothetical protein U1E71_12320 [Ramlibacter sp.]
MRAKQSAQAGACALVVAILLAGCGGGAVDPTPATSVTALARALPATDTGVPLVAEAAAAPQAAVAWTPTGETVMEWAEATYPQHFPAGPWNRFWSGFTYRQYPQTGNILAYSGQGVYVLGPVSGGQALLVGTLSSFSCQINPTGCSGAFSLAPVAAAPASSVPAQSVMDVTAVLRSPARVDATLYLGDSMTTTFLNGSATGNIASLAGRTLYIVVVDPHSLFQATPSVFLSGSSVNVTLSGRTQAVAGLKEGVLKIYVCVDSACTTQLGGSPLSLPYSVSVLPSVTTDQASMAVSVPFGEVPQPRTLQVSLPPYTTGWNASTVYTGTNELFGVRSRSTWGNTVGSVQVSFDPAPPGTYSKTLRITGSQTLPSGRTNSFTKDIPLAYTVTASSVDYVIWPAETVAVRQYGDALVGPGYRRVATANTGASIRWAGIEYLTAPAGASGRSLAQSWWSELNTPSPSSCVITSSGPDCLPTGTYTARVRYTVTRSGGAGTTTVYHPVTMQIYP